MNIIIDGDGTSGIKIIETLAQKYNISVSIYHDYSHNITSEYSSIHKLDTAFQNVDIAISNIVKENDIVITNDYGLALMVLSKKAIPIKDNGFIFTKDNIDNLIYIKYVNQKQRKQNHHIKGPKKRKVDDDKSLIENLEKLLN